MARGPTGIYTLPPSYLAVSGQTIRTEQHNPPLEDIAQALTDSLPRNGTAPMAGNLPMGANRITDLGAATQPSDAVRFDQAQPLNATLTSMAALGAGFVTAAGMALLDDADAAAQRATLGAQAALGFTPVEQGGGVGMNTSKIRVGWSGSQVLLQVDATPLGQIYTSERLPSSAGIRQTISIGGKTSDVTYQNTTGSAIFVSVASPSTTTNTSLSVGPTAGSLATVSTFGSGTAPRLSTCCAIVPAGWFYRHEGPVSSWVEIG